MTDHVLRYSTIPSRWGEVTLIWREDDQGPKVIEILLPRRRERLDLFGAQRGQDEAMDRLSEALHDYLEGNPVDLLTRDLDWDRCSPFQTSVLRAERTIPRGRVATYRRLAARVGSPKAARAAGTALARNPFPIIIPCHRTIRSDGSLGGFGGGLPMKRDLLEMEGVAFDQGGRVAHEFFWDWPAGS